MLVNKKIIRQPQLTTVVASFKASPLSGIMPLNVTFTDKSTGSPINWSWNFGDNTTSTVQNPTHIFIIPGIYTVSLTVTNINGSNALTKNNYIHYESIA